MTQDVTAVESTMKIPADPEPTSLRIVLLGILALGAITGYVLTLVLVPDSAACSPLALIIGVIVGAAAMQGAEWMLKPRWQSHTFLEVSPYRLNILKRDRALQEIETDGQPRLHLWRFEVKRSGRVPKGWFMVGTAAEVDDIYLPVYALISPEQLEILPYGEHFTTLISRDEIKKAGKDVMRLSGLQRRLLKAETARDLHGIEVTYDNMLVYLDWIKVHFPEWLPTN